MLAMRFPELNLKQEHAGARGTPIARRQGIVANLRRGTGPRAGSASGERALEGGSVGRRTVSRQDVLDRPLEQRAQSLDDLFPRHALG
jgi:hypothetical protein